MLNKFGDADPFHIRLNKETVIYEIYDVPSNMHYSLTTNHAFSRVNINNIGRYLSMFEFQLLTLLDNQHFNFDRSSRWYHMFKLYLSTGRCTNE